MSKNDMNDETDKLAAQMQNLRPSKTSRESGMGAAMAAFNQEFAAEKTAEKTAGKAASKPAVAKKSEKNSTSLQGTADALRPTGTHTKMVNVMTRREATMAKLKSVFNFKPQTMMMAGTCSAALIAAMIVLPNMDDLGQNVPLANTESVKVTQDIEEHSAPLNESADVTESKKSKELQAREEVVDEITVTGSRRLESGDLNASPVVVEAITAEDIEASDALDLPSLEEMQTPPTPAPTPQGGINSVNELLSKIHSNAPTVEGENRERLQHFQSSPSDNAKLAQEQAIREYRATLQQRDNVQLFQSQGTLNQTLPSPPQIERQSAAIKPSNSNPRAAIPGRTRIVIPSSGSGAQAPTSGPEKIGGLTLEEVPGTESITETVVVQPASVEYVQTPPVYETVIETVVVQEASTELVTIPPTYNPDGTIATPAQTLERAIPSVTRQETRRVVKTPASTIERAVPAITKQVLVRTPKYILRDDDGTIVREFESRDAFEIYKANLPTPVAETPVSTFSVDVDTSSYSFLRASINAGKLPPRESIRLEEMINYFPYDYEAPKSAAEPFKANVTVTSNPWNADTKLMHVGIKGYVPKEIEKPRSNLVFLIDTSGSMNRPNKLPLLINSFKLLLNTLDEDDTVSIVAYASASGTVLEPTQVKNKSEILAALNNLRAGGSTAGAAGLELAYQKAQENFDDEGVNRVILATDGDFNVGFSSPDDMKAFVEKKRKTGIFLSVLGFGMGNYNDHLMQSLAQNGNGVAAYIDTLAEANKVLADEAGGALFTIAKDVKIQVEFNPAEVAEYRLIGYETRALKRQDFNNDKVDAGEIGAGHSVTAIYEMTPVGSPAVTVDKLRYVSEEPKTSTGSDEYAFVKIRHKLPDADKSTLQTFPIGKRQERSLKRASDDMRFATAVAIVGQKLRGDIAVENYSYEDAIKLAKSAKGEDENGYRAEFIQMVKLIESMSE